MASIAPRRDRLMLVDWPHSSFRRDVRAGLFPQDWAGDVSAEDGFGERV
jgi:putative transposase